MRLGVALAALLLIGCGDSSTTAGGPSDGPLDGPGGTGDGPWTPTDDGGPIVVYDGGVVITDDGGTFTCHVTACNQHILECGDCVDNDGDGLIDWRDPECLGPCDNTESPALTAGIGGETGGPCKADCYFDFGNGPGNDDCHWDHRCDPLAVGPDYPPEGADCAFEPDRVGTTDCPANQSQLCLDYCMPLTPNGCDCFGCCTFPELAGDHIWIGAMDDHNVGTCTFADILEPTKCPPCTPVADCYNGCGHCEICLGKPELPPECGCQVCPPAVQLCGPPCGTTCPVGYFCNTGCCALIPS